MTTVKINDKEFSFDGINIFKIIKNKIFVNDKEICQTSSENIEVTVNGDVGELHAGTSVEVNGNTGSIEAGNSVEVSGNVIGNINAGNSVDVGKDVRGDINSGNTTTVCGNYNSRS